MLREKEVSGYNQPVIEWGQFLTGSFESGFSELLSWPWGCEGCPGCPWVDGGVGKSVQERTHENRVKTSDNQI